MSGRKLITKRGVIVLIFLALLTALAFFLFSRLPAGQYAVVERNGEVIRRRLLSTLSGPVEERIQGENSIELTVIFYPDGAQVLDSQCPDKICVHYGKLTRAGEAAVCLPARVVLRLESGAAGAVDGITG